LYDAVCVRRLVVKQTRCLASWMANFVVIEKSTREMQFKKFMQVKIIPFFEPKKIGSAGPLGKILLLKKRGKMCAKGKKI